jgi:predicted acylesterase/phospholipase RssA
MAVVTRALVLGGGGNTGFAWQWGVITGLHDAGVDLEAADLVVGTSGGAMAAAQLTSGSPPRKLLAVLTRTPASWPPLTVTPASRWWTPSRRAAPSPVCGRR